MSVSDTLDLSRFGYAQELRRSLHSFSSFAAGFSYSSVLTGIFQAFYLGFGAAGPAFFWTWPLVLGGHLLMALCFAELAAEFPLAGGVYQWARRVGSSTLGTMTGWVYLACVMVTLAAVPLALQGLLPPISHVFQITATPGTNAVLLGCVLIVLSTVINAFGVRLLAWINNAGVFVEIIGLLVLIGLLAAHARHTPAEALLDTQARGSGAPGGYLGPFLMSAGLTASYILWGYDTAGTLAEETHAPRRRAPRAILQTIVATGAGGLLLLLTALMAAPNLGEPALGEAAGGLPLIVKAVLGDNLGRAILVAVTFACIACTLATQACIVRLTFAMARDGHLPGSARLARVSPQTGLPLLPTLLSGAGALAILLANINFGKILDFVASVVALWANLAYLLVGGTLLARRLAGRWPPPGERGGFSLGRLGLPINLLAVAWSAAIIINVSWPRAEVYGEAWYQRYGALILTLLLLAAAGGVARLKRRS